MKAVILAAGKGTRMKPMTEDTPKPLLPVAGKPIIKHNIDTLRDEVEEIIIVAGYRIEQFRKEFSDDEDIDIVEQKEAMGTADAALQASGKINEKAIIMNGDDIYGDSVHNILNKNSAVLASEVENPESYGVFQTQDEKATGIIEKPDNPNSNLVNTGCFVVRKTFFNLLKEVKESERGEYEITDALAEYIEKEEVQVKEADRWLPCSYPWQLIDANEELMEDLEGNIEGKIPESTEIKGETVVEENAEIGENCLIEGPAIIKSGAEIGPFSHIRPGTVVEENAHVGRSEIKNSVLRKGSKIPHFNYVGDSYIGKEVNVGAGVKTANLLNKQEKVKMKVKGEMLGTGRKKLGSIIGSYAKIGINSSVKPGRKIGFKASIDSHEKVEKNIPDNSVLKDGEIHENRD